MPKYKFDQIAYNINDKKMPEPGDEEMYIGLEHLDSGSLRVTRWGSDVPIKGQKLLMKKGDILFGRRNTYLRRAAIAPHDGIFSAHGMIFRPKTEVIDEKYFPFFIASDYFMDEAIRISVGSLSPTVNWKTLKELEFVIPELEEQKRLAEILTAADETRESYKKLLAKTDELVKSQFIEMFGDPMTNSKDLPLQKYGEAFELNAGGTPSKKKTEYWEGGTISWIGSNMCHDAIIYENDGNYITEEGLKHSSARLFPVDTVLIALVGATIGRTALLKFETTTNQNVIGVRNIREAGYRPEFVFYYTQGIYGKFTEKGAGFFMASKGFISDLQIPIVAIDKQEGFTSFVKQSDKSKFEIKQAIESLNATIRALVQRDN